ncbi:MAG TPA: hypothetical protein VF667_12585 [Pseudonocardia sp.]
MGDVLGILGSLSPRPAATPQREARQDRSRDNGDSWSETRGHQARQADADED